ncbi:MAG: hypothetical protein PF484_12080 [Bacteroidales bacterium]|jgi:hypothetical protein|nr:hypothetical protein [Bacteroidales bacterium]
MKIITVLPVFMLALIINANAKLPNNCADTIKSHGWKVDLSIVEIDKATQYVGLSSCFLKDTINLASKIEKYVKREIVKMDDREGLSLVFHIANDFSVVVIGDIVNVSKRLVERYKPVENGDLFIRIKYSSKGNDWLYPPSPPVYSIPIQPDK